MNETMNGNANGTEATAAGTTQQNSAEDDDPVIHEIPVFLAKTLAGQLCLFQVRMAIPSICTN